jgi:hypothetical protein
MGRTGGTGGHPDQVVADRYPLGASGEVDHDRPEATADPVPDDCRPHDPGNGVGHPGSRSIHLDAGGSKADPQRTTAHRASVAPEELEVVPSTQSADQADRRARPFRRRAEMMARPARVCIRFRKPCFLARRRVLGWYVRFMSGLLVASVGVVRKGSARMPSRTAGSARLPTGPDRWPGTDPGPVACPLHRLRADQGTRQPQP